MAKDGFVTLYTSNNNSSVSVGGESYDVIDGAVEVPEAAAGTLIESFGFETRESAPKLDEPIGYDKLKQADLKALIDERNAALPDERKMTYAGNASKAVLVALLVANDEAAAGTQAE